jgi:hypothetical protein
MFKIDADFELEAELELELEALAVLEAEPDLKDGGRVNFRVDCNYPSAPSRVVEGAYRTKTRHLLPSPSYRASSRSGSAGSRFRA